MPNLNRQLDATRSVAIIDELGGVAAVAKMFGISHPSVIEWKHKGIPESRIQYLQVKFPRLESIKATKDFHPWTNR